MRDTAYDSRNKASNSGTAPQNAGLVVTLAFIILKQDKDTK